MKILKILIADDDFWVREGLKSTINWNELGFELVGEAEDGDKAYELYTKHSPDIVITDIRMKHTNGLDLIERIHEENSETEFVIMSGYSQFDYAKRAYENGSAAYLLKPINNNELIEILLDIKNKATEKSQLDKRLNILDNELPSLKTSFYNNLIYNDTIADIEEKAAVYNIDLFTPYVLISTELSKMAISDLEVSNKMHTNILEAFDEFSRNYPEVSDYWIFSKFNASDRFSSSVFSKSIASATFATKSIGNTIFLILLYLLLAAFSSTVTPSAVKLLSDVRILSIPSLIRPARKL